MRLGPEAMEKLRSEVDGLLTGNEELVAAGLAGNAGVKRIVKERREELGKRFPASFLAECESTDPYEEECFRRIAFQAGANALILLGEGGFLAGLWKIAEASGKGLRIDLRKVPVDQHTIEICEYFDLHPYMLYSTGAAIIGIRNGQELVERFQEEGIPAAVIGHTTKDNDRLLKSGTLQSYLNRPARDEIFRVIPEFL